jgi:SLT domain-containing protein
MGKLTLLAGGAVGYVLGTRAGRERFEQIKSQAQTLWEHPKVQEQASKVQGVAKRKSSDMQDKVSSSSSSSSSPSSPSPSVSVSSTGTADVLDSPGSLHSSPSDPAPYPTSSTTGPTTSTGGLG